MRFGVQAKISRFARNDNAGFGVRGEGSGGSPSHLSPLTPNPLVVISTNEVRRNLMNDKILRFARNDNAGFGIRGEGSGGSPSHLSPRTPYRHFDERSEEKSYFASLRMTPCTL